jgi:hypothetical protein
MFIDFIGGFLGALGGLAAGVAGLRYLLGKYIEMQISKDLAIHQHGLDKQISTLEAQLSRVSDVLSRRNEREFAVTEKAWELMNLAFGTSQLRFGNGRGMHNFLMKSDPEAFAVIAKLPFDDPEKEQLRNAPRNERDELYERFDIRESYATCHKLWAEFGNYVSSHEIFFAEKIYQAFVEIKNDVFGVLCHAEMFFDPEDEKYDRRTADKMLREISVKVSALATVIRERFGFNQQ